MLRPRALKIIHGEAFDKVCKVQNMVHHVRCIDWDLHILAVLWSYMTMWKTLTTQALPKLKYEAGAIILMEHAKPSLRIATPVDTTIHEAQNEGIT